MVSPRWEKELDRRATLLFQRIHGFYNTFVVLAALVSGLAVAALTFNEFHPTKSGLSHASEGFLCSSAITAVVSAVVATMLLFQFEDLERITRKDLIIAWSPLVLLDLGILEFLVGMVCWYSSKNLQWRSALMATQLVGLLGICFALSVWIVWTWLMLKQMGKQRKDEPPITTIKNIAEK